MSSDFVVVCLNVLEDACSNSVDPDQTAPLGATQNKNEPRHEISNDVVCVTSKTSNQPVHTRSLIRAFASHLHII